MKELDLKLELDPYDQTEEGRLVRSLMVSALKMMLDEGIKDNPGMGRGIFVTGRDGIQYMLLSEGDEIKVHTIDPDQEGHPDGQLFTFDIDPGQVH